MDIYATPPLSPHNTPYVSPRDSPPPLTPDNTPPPTSPRDSPPPSPLLTKYYDGQHPFDWKNLSITPQEITSLITRSLKDGHKVTVHQCEVSQNGIVLFKLDYNGITYHHSIKMARGIFNTEVRTAFINNLDSDRIQLVEYDFAGNKLLKEALQHPFTPPLISKFVYSLLPSPGKPLR